jgi:ornithine carbamoyltransferase
MILYVYAFCFQHIPSMNYRFLTLFDLDPSDLEELFELADDLRRGSYRPLNGKTAMLLFQKQSLRTRVSFEIGIHQLGGSSLFLTQEEIGIGVRESAADVVRVLTRYGDAIIARLFDHEMAEEMARYADVPVINALTDLSHPCQVLADLYTIRQHKRLHEGLRVAFIGDGNNVANSWIEATTLYPFELVIATPEGFEPNEDVLKRAAKRAVGSVTVTNDPVAAATGANAVYTDVWTSMGHESEAMERRRAFGQYQINSTLMAHASDDALVMHCLPAHRGEEITHEVLEGPNSVVFDQAENRLHVQKAVMARLAELWQLHRYSAAARAAASENGRISS